MRDGGFGSKRGMTVEVKGDNVEQAIRVLKKRMANEGVFRDMRRTEEYEKPTAKRRRKAADAVKRHRKALAKKQRFE